MLVLGIDPGTATTGFGLIRQDPAEGFTVIEWGLIETKKETEPHIRLHQIYNQMNELIKRMQPDMIIMEKVFFSNNAKTAIRVGQAQGVIMLSAAHASLPIHEYAPGTIKKMISGNGRAKKDEMQASVRKILGSKVKSEARKKTHFDNAADALAIAMCHIMVING